MDKRDPRKMALQIAGLRAGETHLPECERLFEDPYAEYFFSADIRKMFQDVNAVKTERARYEDMMPGVNGAIVARIKFIDDCLADSLKHGTKQLVIIGAGYDTRAYRMDGIRENLKVFEVDHPATQEIKIHTMGQVLGELPVHVNYVPMIFGNDRLDQRLFESGYDPESKTLFIVEGLLMYIPPTAVDGLLSFINTASGSESAVVGDYFDLSVVEGTSPLKEAQALRKFVEREGAPLQFGIQKGGTEAFFNQRGFRIVADVNAASCKEVYFKGANRNRSVSSMFNFVWAVVQF